MHFIKTASTLALVVAGLAALSLGHAADGNIAVVNGVPVSEARVDYIVKTQIQQGQKDSPELRKNVADVLITREVLTQEAIKKGFDKDPAVVTQMDMAKQEFLIRAYFEDFIKRNPVSDEEITAEYEKIKAAQGGTDRKEYRAAHILLKDEKQANAVLAQINKANGKNFAQLAKAKSEDTGSKKLGGDLDWSDGSNYVKEFSDAMMKLNKGEWTKKPVKTKFGYHIILLEDVRPVQFPPLEQVKDRISQQMLAQKRDKEIEALRAGAKIEQASAPSATDKPAQ
jgi:peptidyl-prolyl cis-trans isomerase C